MNALLLTLLVVSPSPGLVDGQREFDAAIVRESAGDWLGAAERLETLARERPRSTFADDALFEAAVLSEERLADPARAARLYRQVTTQYAESRLARRARTRADFLDASLTTGAAPLAEFQRIQSGATRDPRAAIGEMERLLDQHPDFALTDRALYWLASRNSDLGRDNEAERRLLELERRFPSSEWARRGQKARGDLLLKHGRLRDARGVYLALSRSSDPIARAGGTEGLVAVSTTHFRSVLAWVAAIYLALFALLHGRAWRRLWPLPTELYFYLPVAALFAAAGATEHMAIGWATSGIATGGAFITWLVAAGAAKRRTVSWPERAARALALALAVLAVVFLAIHTTGLTDLVLETIRSGPER